LHFFYFKNKKERKCSSGKFNRKEVVFMKLFSKKNKLRTESRDNSSAFSGGINSGCGRHLLSQFNEREFQILMSLSLTGSCCPNHFFFFPPYYD